VRCRHHIFRHHNVDNRQGTSSSPTSDSEPASARSAEQDSAKDVRKRMRLAHMQDLRHDVDEEELIRLMDESDRATAWVDEHDIDSMQEYVHDRMREFDIPEKEIEAYYSDNRELFGNRNLEESTYAVERILKIQSMKQELQEL
jgi:hypothetical protein